MNGRSHLRREGGFTIVELMVGMVVGLVAMVVMFQVFAVSEAQKRTTTGAGDAQQNGVYSLFQIERDARMAGYGMNYLPLLGCQINAWYEPSASPFQLVLAPVVITNGAGGAPDRITFLYGNSDLFMAPAKLTQSMPSPAALYKVDNRFGFKEGDLVIAAEAGKPCSLAQVSGVPGTPGNSDNVIRNSGNYTDGQGVTRPTDYNRPGGLPAPNNIAYSSWNPATNTGGRVYNIGALPTAVTYAVNNSRLVSLNGFVPGDTAEIAEGIVQIQAQYGYDQNGDGSVGAAATSVALVNAALGQDQWADAMPAGVPGTEWAKVIAMRLAIVARSMQAEKPDPVLGCNATQNPPVWRAKGPVAGVMDVSALADWKCYRYRVFEVTVPIRNLIWLPLPA